MRNCLPTMSAINVHLCQPRAVPSHFHTSLFHVRAQLKPKYVCGHLGGSNMPVDAVCAKEEGASACVQLKQVCLPPSQS